jgi:Asp/Glu/hydantoin racemase
MAHIGLVRVITLTDPEEVNRHGNIIEKHFPGLTVVSRSIPEQPKGIYDDESEAVAVPKIVELGRQFAEEGVDALIVSCAADPALAELRAELSIPVIGAGSAVSGMALGMGSKIGALGITEGAPACVTEVLGSHLVAEARPEGVENTLGLLEPKGQQNAVAAARHLVEEGAELIVLVCTGYSTIGIANDLSKAVGVPVLDAVVAAGAVTAYAVGRTAMEARPV